ncbi:MAG TPA: hypothetical protein VES67_23130 [Vicinamibacterales bacterium]|nr:hypothetical protein [Vicinamibacterales bacterium]
MRIRDWRLAPSHAIAYGTVVVGVLDGLDALIFFGLRGAAPARIFQSIAAGLVGRQTAFQGGAATTLLGVGLHHFVVAFGIVSTYFLLSRKIQVLTRHPLICGALYGVLVYFVMNLVVIPRSALGRGAFPPPLPVLANGVLIHILGVGLPTAFIVGRASPTSSVAR